MKKYFFHIVMVAFFCFNSSCTKSNFCSPNPQAAFEAFKNAVEEKDLVALKGLTDVASIEYIDYDLMLGSVNNPSIFFIPENSDGAYGIKKMGNAQVYYFDLKDGGVVKDRKVVMFQEKDNCFKIINITYVVETDKENHVDSTGAENMNPDEQVEFDGQKFMNKNLKIKKCLHTEEKCNFIQKHYLVGDYNHNNDTLTLSVEILTDSIYESVQHSDDCINNIRCGVYLYKSSKDFEANGLRNWFTMGSKITGEKARVRINQ